MSEPYYEDDLVTLYHGDCDDRFLEWSAADALVTDPPYGIDYRSNWPSELPRTIKGDTDTGARDWVIDMWLDTRREDLGHPSAALVFGTWRVPRPRETRQVLIWDTKGALGMGAMDLPWKPSHQEIYVLGNGFHGPRTSDVLAVAPVQSMSKNGRVHPHEKPVSLMGVLIRKCPEGVIADPFAGSGSTLVAAKAEGRHAIGVEIDERYCEIAARRLAQDTLFGGDVA